MGAGHGYIWISRTTRRWTTILVALNLRPDSGGSKERFGSTLELMKASSRWLIWRYGPIETASSNPKRPKKPHYVDGGPRERADTDDDRARLTSFVAAQSAVNRLNNDEKGAWGVGFALGPDGGGGYWQGHDKDGSKAGMEDWKEGYVEISPSGAGFHVLGYGRPFKSYVHSNEEWDSTGRYFTFSGDKVNDGPVVDLFDRAGGIPLPDVEESAPRAVTRLNSSDLRALRSALGHLDPDPYDTWYRVALAMRQVEDGEDIFLQWSSGSGKHRDRSAKRKLTGTMPHMPWQAILAMAKETGWKQEKVKEPVDFLPQVELDPSVPVATEFVLDGFVKVGSLVIVGHPGVGKTSVLVPLALGVGGLTSGLMKPKIRRKVIYITEDPDQVRQMIHGLWLVGRMKKSVEETNSWFRLFPSIRVAPEAWEEKLKEEVQSCIVPTDLGHGPFDAQPLIVLDTTSATIDVQSENDNSEVSRAVACIRRGAGQASSWFVTHAAKSLDRDDPESLNARGAGAWTGDTQGEMYIITSKADPEARWLVLGKARFSAEFREVKVLSDELRETIPTLWGEQQIIHKLVVGFEASSAEERREAIEEKADLSAAGARPMRVMSMLKRFEARLMTENLAIGTKAGSRAVPEGYVPISIRNELGGSKRDPEAFAEVLKLVQEKWKPVSTDGFLLFERLKMGTK